MSIILKTNKSKEEPNKSQPQLLQKPAPFQAFTELNCSQISDLMTIFINPPAPPKSYDAKSRFRSSIKTCFFNAPPRLNRLLSLTRP